MDLRAADLSDIDSVAAVIRDGRNQMPGFNEMLSEDQLAAVAAHVLELAAQ